MCGQPDSRFEWRHRLAWSVRDDRRQPTSVFELSIDALATKVRDDVSGLRESDVRNVYQMARRDADQMLRSHPGKGTRALSVLYLRPAHKVDPDDGFGDYQGYTVRPNKREKACVLTLTTALLLACVAVFFDLHVGDDFLALRRTRTQRGNVRHSRGTATVTVTVWLWLWLWLWAHWLKSSMTKAECRMHIAAVKTIDSSSRDPRQRLIITKSEHMTLGQLTPAISKSNHVLLLSCAFRETRRHNV